MPVHDSIGQIEALIVDIPLKRPHVVSFGRLEKINFVLVKIKTRRGLVGYGEASTLQGPTWSEECAEGIKLIIDKYIAPLLQDENPYRVGPLMELLDSRVRGNHFAKAAVEFALFDLLGKSLGQPVYSLLGGAYRDRVPLSWSLASGSLEKDLEEAREKMSQGWRIFKLKAGSRPFEEDVHRIKVLRQELGDSVSLRVDVNQGWNYSTALRAIRALEPYGLAFVEQPLPQWDINGLAEIRKRTDVPIMADECLTDEFTCLDIIKKAAADVFAFKLTHSGGLIKARRQHALVGAAGLGSYIGCMFETSLGTAAYLQFAASIPTLTHGCELFGPILLQGDIVDQAIAFEDGQVLVPDLPGLGVKVNEDFISQYKRRREK